MNGCPTMQQWNGKTDNFPKVSSNIIDDPIEIERFISQPLSKKEIELKHPVIAMLCENRQNFAKNSIGKYEFERREKAILDKLSDEERRLLI